MRSGLIVLFFNLGLLALPGRSNAHMSDSGMVVSYSISIEPGSGKQIVAADLYNGGSRVLFTNGTKTKIKLVSLMRVESFYFLPKNNITEISRKQETYKKTGAKKISSAEWNKMNKKYEGAILDTANAAHEDIAGYHCRKATLRLVSGETIELFYTVQLPAINKIAEPAFATIPGLVLQYSYSTANGTIRFKAEKIQLGNINPAVFNPLK
ncbi:MAG: hypothetical protein WAT19_12895 [Ferruginibacter sp.]